MKLPRCFRPQQSLSTLLAASALGFLSLSGMALAEDTVLLKTGVSQAVKITGATAAGIAVQVGPGKTVIPYGSIARVNMVPPAEFTQGMQAYAQKNYASAAANLSSVVTKFRGLPTVWAQQAAATVGDVYLAMNDLPKAEQAYAAFQKAYPGGGGGVAATVGAARIAFAKKDYAGARQKLEPIAAQALKTPEPAPDLASAYSQTFYMLGQIDEQAGDFPAALENYLRTVTLFYKDNVAVASAQEHADALRQAHAVNVP